MGRVSKILLLTVLCLVVLGGVTLSLPTLLVVELKQAQEQPLFTPNEAFPVTVNPKNKTIVESAAVNALFEPGSPLVAAASNTQNALASVFEWVALSITSMPWYQALAGVDARFVVITPGMRKEQVASAFASTLGWDAKQKQTFLTPTPYSSLPLAEGSFSPGVYTLDVGMSSTVAQALVNDRFRSEILSHYGTTTAQIVPLNEALTIASLIEREAGGADDMRIISGIIWNRLFINMPLQIDATLQYAKVGRSGTGGSWWPQVVPSDRFRISAYNTYLHGGLPPTPIASPSVASVLAALNPVNTTCIFYFHDSARQFHCSDTYAEHVALLKKYFGRGK